MASSKHALGSSRVRTFALGGLLGASALAVACMAAPEVRAVDFIRGDVNADGVVTLSDAHLLSAYLFMGLPGELDCMDAADSNDDGQHDIADSVEIYIFSLGLRSEIPSPHPDPGPDASDDDWDCASYGGGAPVEDPAAELAILDAIAAGGANRLAVLTVALSNARRVSGYLLRLRHDSGLIETVGRYPRGLRDLTGIAESGPNFVGSHSEPSPDDVVLQVGYFLVTFPCRDELRISDDCGCYLDCSYILPGDGVPVLELLVCLAPGTPAGDYPLTLEAAELADVETGQAIYPVLTSGTLRVLADVEESDCDSDPPPPPPPPDVVFSLQDREAAPGSAVSVPFRIRATLPSQGFSFSVDFDESVLQATEIERLWERQSGTPFEFMRFEMNNQNAFPGNAGVQEGYLVGAAVISLTDNTDVLPPDDDVPVVNFHFDISPDAPLGETELVFADGALGSDGVPVSNSLISSGRTVTPSTASSFIFIDGKVVIANIVPDGIPFFLRGDSNRDTRVDVSDAVATLGYLFLGTETPRCLDAADADDDGGITLGDAVFTLDFLFRGGAVLPPPFPEPGRDPTADGIICLPEDGS